MSLEKFATVWGTSGELRNVTVYLCYGHRAGTGEEEEGRSEQVLPLPVYSGEVLFPGPCRSLQLRREVENRSPAKRNIL